MEWCTSSLAFGAFSAVSANGNPDWERRTNLGRSYQAAEPQHAPDQSPIELAVRNEPAFVQLRIDLILASITCNEGAMQPFEWSTEKYVLVNDENLSRCIQLFLLFSIHTYSYFSFASLVTPSDYFLTTPDLEVSIPGTEPSYVLWLFYEQAKHGLVRCKRLTVQRRLQQMQLANLGLPRSRREAQK